MVAVYKDILDYLHIEHTFLTGNRNCFCNLLEISRKEWTVAVDVPIPDGEWVIHIKYEGEYTELKVTLKNRQNMVYTLTFLPMEEDRRTAGIFESIEKLEKNTELWNKRKEERHVLGAEFSEEFGLKKVEQKVIITGKEYPCMINDISFQGMKLTTLETGSRKGEEIAVLLDFINPIERVMVKGYIQSVLIKSGEKTKYRFAILSVKFPDTPLALKERVGSYMIRKDGK
jgi:c-di-GMP-binding flagellar brake protein YcgR